MAMGRGSDTRLYAPRSESDHMHTSANEDETKYNPTSPEDNEKRREEKKLKEEEKKENHSKLKHIKISAKRGLSGTESPVGEDDSNKQDEEREIGLQGGPAGSRGTLLDLATGAKSGTGSAMSPGLPIAMSEPMKDAWSSLMKEEPTVHPGENQYKHGYEMPNRDDVHPEWYNWIQEQIDNPAEYEGIADDFQQPDINHLAGATSREDFFERLYDLHNFQVDDTRPPFDDIEGKYRDFTDVPFNEHTGFTMSEPMAGAWSELLKREILKGTEDWHHDAAYELRHISHSRGEPMSYEGAYDELDRMHRDILEQLGYSEEVIQNQLSSQNFLDDNRDYDLWEKVMLPLRYDINSVYQDMDEKGELIPHEEYNYENYAPLREDNQPPQNIQTSEPMKDAWSSLLKEDSGDEPYRTPTCFTCGRVFATPEDLEYHYSVTGHSGPYEKDYPNTDNAGTYGDEGDYRYKSEAMQVAMRLLKGLQQGRLGGL